MGNESSVGQASLPVGDAPFGSIRREHRQRNDSHARGQQSREDSTRNQGVKTPPLPPQKSHAEDRADGTTQPQAIRATFHDPTEAAMVPTSVAGTERDRNWRTPSLAEVFMAADTPIPRCIYLICKCKPIIDSVDTSRHAAISYPFRYSFVSSLSASGAFGNFIAAASHSSFLPGILVAKLPSCTVSVSGPA